MGIFNYQLFVGNNKKKSLQIDSDALTGYLLMAIYWQTVIIIVQIPLINQSKFSMTKIDSAQNDECC